MQQGARRFPGRPEPIGAARRFVAAALVAWPATQDTARLLVSEVVTNAILHAASGGEDGSVEVRYTLDDQEAYAEVVDAGSAAHPRRHGESLQGSAVEA
jgi:serine/threonine-protein kinase RsbW